MGDRELITGDYRLYELEVKRNNLIHHKKLKSIKSFIDTSKPISSIKLQQLKGKKKYKKKIKHILKLVNYHHYHLILIIKHLINLILYHIK